MTSAGSPVLLRLRDRREDEAEHDREPHDVPEAELPPTRRRAGRRGLRPVAGHRPAARRPGGPCRRSQSSGELPDQVEISGR